ncbi:MAG: multiheme c-type cytochrome [Cyclobacteriaceae bacterium]
MKFRNIIWWVLALGVGYIVYFSVSTKKRMETVGIIIHPSGQSFAGSARCATCHADIYKTHLATAHFRTSAVADRSTIKGSFSPDSNFFVFNAHDRMVMEARDSGLFQAGYTDQRLRGVQSFDITIGSGTKGQTYLHWFDNNLVQLPISYYTPNDSWASSPGYPTDRFVINRPVPAPCLNCHSTYFKTTYKMNALPEFDRSQVIYGIDCERCHGPGMQHVLNQEKGTARKDIKDIINAAHLSRRQQLDACAQCHSGINTSLKPPFTFFPGDTLAMDVASFQRYDTTATAEVHGNQYGMLAASQCFIKSEMTCSTCHNPHQKERGDIASFSARCMNCHQQGHEKVCALSGKPGQAVNGQCPDCHMPVRPSRKIAFKVANGEQKAELARTHFISIYPEQSRKIVASIKQLATH